MLRSKYINRLKEVLSVLSIFAVSIIFSGSASALGEIGSSTSTTGSANSNSSAKYVITHPYKQLPGVTMKTLVGTQAYASPLTNDNGTDACPSTHGGSTVTVYYLVGSGSNTGIWCGEKGDTIDFPATDYPSVFDIVNNTAYRFWAQTEYGSNNCYNPFNGWAEANGIYATDTSFTVSSNTATCVSGSPFTTDANATPCQTSDDPTNGLVAVFGEDGVGIECYHSLNAWFGLGSTSENVAVIAVSHDLTADLSNSNPGSWTDCYGPGVTYSPVASRDTYSAQYIEIIANLCP